MPTAIVTDAVRREQPAEKRVSQCVSPNVNDPRLWDVLDDEPHARTRRM